MKTRDPGLCGVANHSGGPQIHMGLSVLKLGESWANWMTGHLRAMLDSTAGHLPFLGTHCPRHAALNFDVGQRIQPSVHTEFLK